MMKLEEMIYEKVMGKLNLDKIADELQDYISNNPDLKERYLKQIENEYGLNRRSLSERLRESVFLEVTDRLATEFIKIYGQQILASIDVKAVINAASLAAGRKVTN